MKDKEDQGKYYLGYPKPLVLVMMCANRDINVISVVVWANIPEFNTLDDIVTPLILVELLFDKLLVDMILGGTTLYSHR